MNKLSETRNKISQIDSEMARLFEGRMRAVSEVAKYKKSNGMSIFDAVREKQVIEQNAACLSDSSLKPYYRKFITNVMGTSKQYQKRLMNAGVVGYQGIPGAYSHIALKNLFPDYEEKSFETFEDVFKAVINDEISWGVVPFENSYTGEVGEILDLLYRYDLHIVDTFDLKIVHNMLGVKGTSLKDVKRVYSHFQAFGQCRRFLNGFDFELVPCLNTAIAAKFVSEANDDSVAAIASSQTADLYGLDVLVPDINTSADNATRFIVLSKEELKGGNRFSLLFTVEHTAGSLAAVMQIIAKYGFNMECIRSKPIRKFPWQYYFYMELIGNIKSEKVRLLLDKMNRSCRELKIIGSYQKD